tara:strand:+ start:604 stop:1476 length:873 start_codon:yes stop_codon:yes gene_type:complete
MDITIRVDSLEEINSSPVLMETERVREEVITFKNAVNAELPSIKFGNRDYNSVWLYMSNDVFPLGWIGYGDYRDSGTMGECFIVHSRTIVNNKYDSNTQQHHMRMSGNLDVAIRNVKKYARRYTTHELARYTWKAAIRAQDRAREDTFTPMNNLNRNLFGRLMDSKMSSPMHKEMFHLVQSGHQFFDTKFNSDMHELYRLKNELGSSDNIVNHTFVYVYKRWGETYVDTLPCDGKYSYALHPAGDMGTYAEADIPEHILERIAVLQMCSKEHYVWGIGTSLGDGMFYVTN